MTFNGLAQLHFLSNCKKGPDLDKDGLISRGINLIFEKIKEKENFGGKVNGGFCLIIIKIM